MRYLLVLLGLILANTTQAFECGTVPDCEELGYVQEDDPDCKDDGYLPCPFDPKYHKCVNMDRSKMGFTKEDKSSWCNKLIKCKGDTSYTLCQNMCEVGDVYYADGSCGKVENYEPETSPEPVGIVYWLKDNGAHGKVINLHDLGIESELAAFDPTNPYNPKVGYFYYGYYNYDIPTLKNYRYSKDLLVPLQTKDPDLYMGRINTDKILAEPAPFCTYTEGTKEYVQNCVTRVLEAVRDFYPPKVDPGNPFVGKGKWYLPALGEWLDIYGYDNAAITNFTGTSGAIGDNKERIEKNLTVLKEKGALAEPFSTEPDYWSSTESSGTGAWILRMKDGYRGSYKKNNEKSNTHHVRVGLEF